MKEDETTDTSISQEQDVGGHVTSGKMDREKNVSSSSLSTISFSVLMTVYGELALNFFNE